MGIDGDLARRLYTEYLAQVKNNPEIAKQLGIVEQTTLKVAEHIFKGENISEKHLNIKNEYMQALIEKFERGEFKVLPSKKDRIFPFFKNLFSREKKPDVLQQMEHIRPKNLYEQPEKKEISRIQKFMNFFKTNPNKTELNALIDFLKDVDPESIKDESVVIEVRITKLPESNFRQTLLNTLTRVKEYPNEIPAMIRMLEDTLKKIK